MHVSMDAAALKRCLQDGGELALLDIREAGQYGEGHLFLATSLPYSRLELDIGRLVPRRGARVVLCGDAAEPEVAVKAAQRAAALGYSDIHVLEGGAQAWQAAGHALYRGVNVPSKVFGELVEHATHTPSITAVRLKEMMAAGEPFVLLDGRPHAEYRKMSIPGAACCPNGELALRVRALARDPAVPVVVNCAGRTRSIMGAQTLIAMGLSNPVYALQDGTQGWMLAGLELEHGAGLSFDALPDAADLAELRKTAAALMRRHGAGLVSAHQIEGWLADASRTTYLLDVRTAEEYAAGHVAGAVHAPGGQLVQATDHWVAVRNARLVLIDGEQVRAPVIASWLRQMGHESWVLEEVAATDMRSLGLAAGSSDPSQPRLASVSAAQAASLQQQGALLIDLRPSMDYRRSHAAGAVWSIRPRIAPHARAGQTSVLIADHPAIAHAAALDLMEAGAKSIMLLEGGFGAWSAAGLPVEATPHQPADAECIDYLFFVHDRHAGNLDSARRYLAWERGLMAQLDAQERAVFRLYP